MSFFFEGAPDVPGVVNVPDQSDSMDYITKFIASSDGLALVRAFGKIKDSRVQRQLIDLITAGHTNCSSEQTCQGVNAFLIAPESVRIFWRRSRERARGRTARCLQGRHCKALCSDHEAIRAGQLCQLCCETMDVIGRLLPCHDRLQQC